MLISRVRTVGHWTWVQTRSDTRSGLIRQPGLDNSALLQGDLGQQLLWRMIGHARLWGASDTILRARRHTSKVHPYSPEPLLSCCPAPLCPCIPAPLSPVLVYACIPYSLEGLEDTERKRKYLDFALPYAKGGDTRAPVCKSVFMNAMGVRKSMITLMAKSPETNFTQSTGHATGKGREKEHEKSVKVTIGTCNDTMSIGHREAVEDSGNELEDQAGVIVEGADGAEDREVLMIGN